MEGSHKSTHKQGKPAKITVLKQRKSAKTGTSQATLQRQFRLYIPFLGIARPLPQFLHTCVCPHLNGYSCMNETRLGRCVPYN
jgi:hypothetical protein